MWHNLWCPRGFVESTNFCLRCGRRWSEMVDFAPGAATWWIRWNIRQRRMESRLRGTYSENLVKFRRVVIEICKRTDRQTDRQTDTLVTILCVGRSSNSWVLTQYRRVTDRWTDRCTVRQKHDDGKYRASTASRGSKLKDSVGIQSFK